MTEAMHSIEVQKQSVNRLFDTFIETARSYRLVGEEFPNALRELKRKFDPTAAISLNGDSTIEYLLFVAAKTAQTLATGTENTLDYPEQHHADVARLFNLRDEGFARHPTFFFRSHRLWKEDSRITTHTSTGFGLTLNFVTHCPGISPALTISPRNPSPIPGV